MPPDTPGAVRIVGTLYDGTGAPVPDGLVETWQADPDGRFDHSDDPRGASAQWAERGLHAASPAPAPSTAARSRSSPSSPGRLPAGDGTPQAPHLDVSVFARGMLDRVVTRIYFPDEAEANAADPVLSAVDPDAAAHAGGRGRAGRHAPVRHPPPGRA